MPLCERMRACVRVRVLCVCLCVLKCSHLGNIKLLYLRNNTADRAEVWCVPKGDVALSLVPFLLKLIHELGFYDNLNVSKMSVTTLAAANFERSR